jgi:hypothetical protein
MAQLTLLKRLGLPPRVSNQKVVSSVLPLLKTLREQDPDEFAVVNAEFKDYKACTVRDIEIVSNFYRGYNKRPSTKVLTDFEIARVLEDIFDYLPTNLQPGMLVDLVTTYFNRSLDVEGFESELKEMFLCEEFQESIDYLEQNGYEVGMFSKELVMDFLCPRKLDWWNGCIEWGFDSEYELDERGKVIVKMNDALKYALENLFFLPLDELKVYGNKHMARVVLSTLKECMMDRVESAGYEDEDKDEDNRWNEIEKRIDASAEIVKEKQEKIVALEKQNDSLTDENAKLKRELQLLLTLTEERAEKKAKHDA